MEQQLKIEFSNGTGLEFVTWLKRVTFDTPDSVAVSRIVRAEAKNGSRTWSESAVFIAREYPREYAVWRTKQRLLGKRHK